MSVWTIAGLGWRLSWLEVRVNLQAVDITGLGHQVGGHLRAFYHGGNDMGDIAVDYVFQGLQAGNKYVGVADRVSSVRDPVGRGARPQGVIGGGILAHQFLGVP